MAQYGTHSMPQYGGHSMPNSYNAPAPPYPSDFHGFPSSGEAASYYGINDSKISQPMPAGGQTLRFPPTFNVYTSKRFSSKLTYIDPTGSQPIYALSTHSARDMPELVLHDGVNKEDNWLATSTAESAYHENSNTVTIPALGQEGNRQQKQMTTLTLKPKMSWRHMSFAFSLDVGRGKEVHTEQFEWRQTRGQEIDGLKGSSKGWKLVRLGCNEEVLAVFSNPKNYFTNDFEFKFLGSALTGMLGERFEVMAVITALRVWYLRFQPNMGDPGAK